jgi:predicted nucleic acid-binding protein
VGVTDWLIDKSALIRLGDAVDGQMWADRIERGLVRISTVTRLEIGAAPVPEMSCGLVCAGHHWLPCPWST